MNRTAALRRVVRRTLRLTMLGIVPFVGLVSVVPLSGCDGGSAGPVAQPGLAPETPAPPDFDYSKAMEGQTKGAAKKK